MTILGDLSFRSAERLIPYQATLELTYRCNERCGHCYLATYDDAEDGRPPLAVSEWKRILDQLADAGTMVLVLIGGEAMLHPDFWEISEHAAARGFAITLITNGLLLSDEAADRMKSLNFYNVTVSVYSLRPEIHDRMTSRKGSHLRTMEGIAKLRARGIHVGVSCLLTSENIDTALELSDWGSAHGIQVKLDPMVTAKSDGALDSTVTRAAAEQLRNYYRKLRERGSVVGPVSLDEDAPVCNQGRGKCAVNAYGDLLTCLEVRDPIGNLREQDFATLWSSEKAQRLRGYRNRDLKFDYQDGDGAYCDHCPGMAEAESGDRMAPVPFLMDLARIKREVFSGGV